MNAEQEARARAQEYRETHGLGIQPLGDLVSLIERVEGIDIAILPVDDPDAHGITMRDPVTGVTRIAAACTENPMRQRSTLAHELAHHLFNDHGDPNEPGWGLPGPVETRADAFARHFLLPQAAVEVALPGASRGRVTESDLSTLVQQYLVSPAIAAIQLSNCGLIDQPQKEAWMSTSSGRLAARYGWTEQYASLQGESSTHRSPQRLLARLTDAYLDNVIGLGAIARVRQVPEATLKDEFEREGLVPAPPDVIEDDDITIIPATSTDLAALDAIIQSEINESGELNG